MKNWKVILQSNTFFLFLFGVLIVYLIIYFNIPKKSLYTVDQKEVEGLVIDYQIDGDTLTMTLKKKEKIKVFYTIKTQVEKEWLKKIIEYGTELKVEGSMEYPKENTIPNTFNYKEYLYYEHIHFIIKGNKISVLKKPNILYTIKNKLVKYIKTFPCSAYLEAFILGNATNLNNDNLRKNGLSHLFAVSGMHFSFFILILRKIGKKEKKLHQIITDIILLFYVFLVSFTPSILRVYLLYMLSKINRQIGGMYQRKQLLFLAFFLLLMIDPFYLKNIAFQYTFIIGFALCFTKETNNYLKNLWHISYVTFLVSLPITALNFYEINVLSIILNLLFVPFVSFILYPCCFIILICPLCTSIYQMLINIFESLNNFWATISLGHIIIPQIPIYFWLIYEIVVFIYIKENKIKWLKYIIVFMIAIKFSSKLSPSSFIYFIDVGQGDATLFISPHQKEVILIDTGGSITYQKEQWQEKRHQTTKANTLIDFFHSLGIKKINTLVLTHGDMDHLGNAHSILKKMKVDHIILNHNEKNKEEEKIANTYPQKIKENLESNYFKIEEYTAFEEQKENESSLIYQITVESYKFLMMGDAPQKIEEKMLAKQIKSNVIKIGHHGSNTSSSYPFLKKVSPEYAIISVGINNRYNHPSKETIKALENLAIPYYETSKYKTILFKIKNGQMKFLPFPCKS